MSTFGAMSGAFSTISRVREVHEVDHPGGLEGDLAHRLGRVDGEGLEEVAGVAQGLSWVQLGAAVVNLVLEVSMYALVPPPR